MSDVLEKGRVKLLLWTCAGLIAAVWALIAVWLISGDLQWETAVAGAVLTLILAGIGLLAWNGRSRAAAWVLVALLMLLITADSASFGLDAPGSAAFVLPVVLAACALGLWPGVGTAAAASLIIWLIAWGTTAGWYEAYGTADMSHLTFNAPFYSVVLVLTAVIAGSWSHYLTGVMAERDQGLGTGDFQTTD